MGAGANQSEGTVTHGSASLPERLDVFMTSLEFTTRTPEFGRVFSLSPWLESRTWYSALKGLSEQTVSKRGAAFPSACLFFKKKEMKIKCGNKKGEGKARCIAAQGEFCSVMRALSPSDL